MVADPDRRFLKIICLAILIELSTMIIGGAESAMARLLS
jgi:hypothetical protein